MAMTAIRPALAALCLLGSAACVVSSASDRIERSFRKSFDVAPGAQARVRVSGGAIRVTTRPGTEVTAVLTARVRADTERQAQAALDDYEIVMSQSGSDITVSARRRRAVDVTNFFFGDHGGVSVGAEITAPPDVVLDLGTSGGRITVHGDRSASLRATTSGGSIDLDGGTGQIDAATSGGSIRVERVLTRLRADTSGGSIRVGYVGPKASVIDLSTSGGGIEVGIDPQASLTVSGRTSGGSVTSSGLPLDDLSRRREHNVSHNRSQLDGVLNGGAGTLTAGTSGGSVRFKAVTD